MLFTRLKYTLLFLVMLNFSYAQKWGDYTFYSVQNSSAAYLIDTNNAVFKTWTFSSAPTGYSSYLMPGGDMYRTVKYTPNSFQGGGQTGKLQKVAYNGTVLWDYVYSTSTYSMHHDICPMPNGNVLLISYESKTATEVTAAGGNSAIAMWPEKIVEVKQTGPTTGDVVWEWHVWDHLVQNVNSSKSNYQTSISDHPELLNINYKQTKDWIHMNGIDYNPILDQIVFSSHNLNEWYVIDHSTTTAEAASHSGGNAGKGGDFLYRWGNPAAYGATGTAILNVTHDAHWIPEGSPNAGRLVGYNNKGVSSSQSSVDQIIPPRVDYNYTKEQGAPYAPSTYLQRLACSGYSSNMSNSLQLPNGNTFVCMATLGYMYEVNSAGTLLWSKTATGTVAQAQRLDKCYLNNPAPAIPTITLNGNSLEASKASTYQWYKNGNLLSNENNKTITPTSSGIYVVRITDSVGCVYQYSAGFKHTVSNAFFASVSSAKTSICSGDSTEINSTLVNASDTTSYSWSSNPAGFTASTKDISVQPLTTTTYILTASDSNRISIDSVTIVVNPIPSTPIISLLNDSTLSASANTSYQWFLETNPISNATQQNYKPLVSGNYSVVVYNSTNCASEMSASFEFTKVAQGISKEDASRLIQVYPNPSNGIFKINGEVLQQQNYEIQVFDSYGKQIAILNNPTEIDLSNHPSGIYFIQLKSIDGSVLRKKISLIK